MEALVGSAANPERVSIGGKIRAFIGTPFYPTLRGTAHTDQELQTFHDKIVASDGAAQEVFAQVDIESEKKASNGGDLRIENPQIVLNKEFNTKELGKVAVAHEYGHLQEHHNIILIAIIIVNVAMLAIPYFSLTTFLFSFFASSVLVVPMTNLMEIRADNFAFEVCLERIDP